MPTLPFILVLQFCNIQASVKKTQLESFEVSCLTEWIAGCSFSENITVLGRDGSKSHTCKSQVSRKS